MIILVDQVTARLKYTMDFVFKSNGIDYSFTTNVEDFSNSSNGALNYSSNLKGGIEPSTLLYVSDIRAYELGLTDYLGEECLTLDGVCDPLAAIFYVVARYEEYLPYTADQHGRFPFNNSCLHLFDWIEKAKCDRWGKKILEYLNVESSQNRKGQIIPTFDIDNTYAYKLKGGKRKLLSMARDIAKRDVKRIRERKSVLKGGKDPYDTYDKILRISEAISETKVFWLVGDLAEKDRNISIDNKEHQDLIRTVANSASVGLHPSYASHLNKLLLSKERKELSQVIDKPILNSRQHFLRFDIPRTFELLLELGFTDEYSMGFAERAGFRSGTARSHNWFNVKADQETELIVHPFVYMDGTLNEYMQLTLDESKHLIKELYTEINEFGGDFVFIWHNETIGDYGIWENWSEILDYTLNLNNE